MGTSPVLLYVCAVLAVFGVDFIVNSQKIGKFVHCNRFSGFWPSLMSQSLSVEKLWIPRTSGLEDRSLLLGSGYQSIPVAGKLLHRQKPSPTLPLFHLT